MTFIISTICYNSLDNNKKQYVTLQKQILYNQTTFHDKLCNIRPKI